MQAEEAGLTLHILTLPDRWRNGISIVTFGIALPVSTLIVDLNCLREGKLAKEKDYNKCQNDCLLHFRLTNIIE